MFGKCFYGEAQYRYQKITLWEKWKIWTSLKIEKYELQFWGIVCLRFLVKINWKRGLVYLSGLTPVVIFFF